MGVGAAAGIAVVAALGAMLLLPQRPPPGPVASASAGPVRSPNATPTTPARGSPQQPTPTPEAGDGIAVTWDTVTTNVAGGSVHRVGAESGVFHALGSVGPDAAVWRSRDGITWSRSLLPRPAAWTRDAPTFTFAEHLAAVGGRTLVIGTVGALDRLEVVTWESTDGGATWTEVRTGAFAANAYRIRDLTAGPGGLLAVRTGFTQPSGGVWLSSDGGHTWQDVQPSSTPIDTAAVVGTARGYLVAGGIARDGTGPIRPAVWSSPDGRRWAELSIEGTDRPGQVEQLTVNGAGEWVAVGQLDGRPVAWRSADGLRWELTAGFTPPPGAQPSADLRLAGAPGGFCVVDLRSSAGSVTTWTSVDGRDWVRRVDTLPATLRGGTATADGIARLGDRLMLAFGRGQRGSDLGWSSWQGTIRD